MGSLVRRILIVEDNRDAADSLKEALELESYDVAVAYSGAEALTASREFKPEVVLCDIGLPGMDGYEVARALRSDPVTESVFLIALTGYGLPEDQQRARAAGFERHITKPPDIEMLCSLIRGVGFRGIG